MAESTQHCVRDDVNVCQLCGDLDNLSLCGGCKGAWYCSKSHQRQDWKNHKRICKREEQHVNTCTHTNSTNGNSKVDDSDSAETNTTKPAVEVRHITNETKKMTRNNESSESEGVDQTELSILFSSDKLDASKMTVLKLKGSSEGLYESETSDVPSQKDSQSKQVDLKTKMYQPKTYKTKQGSRRQNPLQRYYLDQTTQVFDLPPSISELSRSKSPDSTKADPISLSKSREQYLLILQARFNEVSKYVVKCLTQYGICVVDKFLGDATCEEIFQETIQLKASGMMNQGQLVNGPSSSSKNKHIRGDIITWVDGGESHCQNIHYLTSCMDTVMLQVAKKLENCNINERTKAMVACYPGKGRGYIRHIDNPNGDGRCVTSIYYLNKDWDFRNDGGLLRIYPEGSDQVANIEPVRDRLLFFWSDRRNPHEVEKALRERYAITVWYYDADERAQALKRLKEGASN